MARSSELRTDGQFATEAGLFLMLLPWRLLVGLWLAALFPMLSGPLLLAGAAGWLLGWPYGVGVIAAQAVGLLAWWWRAPGSYRRWVGARIEWRFRRWDRYTHRWARLCAMHGFATLLDERVHTPRLIGVAMGGAVDVLMVRMIAGQSVEDWANQSDELANTFRAFGVRVRALKPQVVALHVHHTDRLAVAVPLPALGDGPVDLNAVPVGLTETGQPWTIKLRDGHWLLSATTRAGKSTTVQALLAGLGPAIGAGLVRVLLIDPKGGVEFTPVSALLERFAYAPDWSAVALLRDAVAIGEARMARMRAAGHRKWQHPSVTEPFILVVIDELAALTTYSPDKALKAEVAGLLGLLQTMGAAPGICVVGCLQDPRKETIPSRDLFPFRYALRLQTKTQVDMALMDGAWDQGARCNEIPEDMRGVGYVLEEGASVLIRVRSFNVTDDDIARVVAKYSPGLLPPIGGGG